MPLNIIQNDITKVHVDAIVNATNSALLGGGGVNDAIHRAAGPELLAEYHTLGELEVGQAKLTKGYKLPAKYVIHTVAPIWRDGKSNEEKFLADCYLNSLELAREYHLESKAFPLISPGFFEFPKDKAINVAISVIGDFLLMHEIRVLLVVYDKTAFMLSETLFSSINRFIDDNYIEESCPDINNRFDEILHLSGIFATAFDVGKVKRNLDDVIMQIDETFTQMLLRLIDQKGMTDAETYKRANIDRKLFSKIRNGVYYKPRKTTALAFAIALRLNLDETKDLLLKAGYALSHSCIGDIIVEYHIQNGNYNIFEINRDLFKYNQKLLGC